MMSLKLCEYNLKEFSDVYEPSEDSFLFLDALECDIDFICSLQPTNVVEVGSGSGVIITSLGLALKYSCRYYATDVNALACLATSSNANLNGVAVECVNMDLLNNFKSLQFDVILFNPPYVVTESDEIVGNGINRAWAGGKDGREIIDQFLLKLNEWLSPNGVCYMVAIKENKVDEIKVIMYNLGFNTVIVKERKILGEHLFVLRFKRF